MSYVIESQYAAGPINKKLCDFCNDEPENDILIEKPQSMIVKGELIKSHREEPLYICLDCLTTELENM